MATTAYWNVEEYDYYFQNGTVFVKLFLKVYFFISAISSLNIKLKLIYRKYITGLARIS